MREDLRRDCTDIWVIDCSPEGHQPDVPTRIFEDVQQPVCIVLAARTLGKDRTRAARLRFTSLPEGRREEKFGTLSRLALEGAGWAEGPTGWRSILIGTRWKLGGVRPGTRVVPMVQPRGKDASHLGDCARYRLPRPPMGCTTERDGCSAEGPAIPPGSRPLARQGREGRSRALSNAARQHRRG